MELFQWNSSFSVSNASIDEEHKTLFALINQLYQALSEGKANDILVDVVDELIGYTKKHFRREEDLMRSVNYPMYEEHIEQHKEFEFTVFKFKQQLKSPNGSLSVDIISFIGDWLIQHIQGVDMMYVPYIEQQQAE